jgi:monoamine oxidase
MLVTNGPVWPPYVDVIVVGGGFSGLQAALDVHTAGLRCVILEANDRVGGKSFTKPLKSGRGVVEMGCTWFNNTTQKRVAGLVQKYGLESKEQYVAGDEIFYEAPGKIHKNKHGVLPEVCRTRLYLL